jgi:hypothetical protein
MTTAPNFWRSVFSEDDGTASFSRVLSALVTAFALGWVTAIVWSHVRTRTEPILPDFGGLVMFMGVFYGINIGGHTISKFTGNRGRSEEAKEP